MIHRYFHSTDEAAPGLLKVALKKVDKEMYGDVRLIISIMESSITDMDEEYINDFGLRNHCYLLQLDYHDVHAAFIGMYGMIITNKEWRG